MEPVVLASQPLFDLAQIDLDARVMDVAGIEAVNPHRGPMRQLDGVIWADRPSGSGLGVKYVREDEFWVEGHIPGRPLLPGVLMIEAAAQLSSVLYHIKTEDPGFMGFTRCDKVVFRGQVCPGDTFYLLCREVSLRRRRFVCETQGIVKGVLVFESHITGMVM